MQVETLGFVILLLGALGLFARPGFLIHLFVVSILFGASAAILLTSLGGANIQPAHLLLAFLAPYCFIKTRNLRAAVHTLAFPKAGFWLLLTLVYGIVSATFFPRLFEGATDVYAIARTDGGDATVLVPLGPTSGNITQTIYFIGDVVCFLIFYAYARNRETLTAVTHAILACTAANLVFAALDLGTYWTHTTQLLDFLHDANYSMLNTATAAGFKRIVGSFPEASTFGYFTLGWCAFCTSLWLRGVRRRVTAPLAALSFLSLVFSTSSSAYAGLFGLLAVLYLESLWRLSRGPVTRATLAFLVAFPIVAAALTVALALDPPAWAAADRLVEGALFNKFESSSAVLRGEWTRQAFANFLGTDFLGGGIGSVRASSFEVAVLGDIGIFGALTYGIFLLRVFVKPEARSTDPFAAAVQSAARTSCLAQLISASVAGSFVDLGLSFFMFAALACAGPVAHPARRSLRSLPAPALPQSAG
jgi:hypothetical protein